MKYVQLKIWKAIAKMQSIFKDLIRFIFLFQQYLTFD